MTVLFGSYCLDDPINLVDPLGLEGEKADTPAAPDAASTEVKPANPNAPKEGAWKEYDLPGVGKTFLDKEFGDAVLEWRDEAGVQGIDLKFSEAFRSNKDQVKMFNNPRAINPASPGTSLHESGRGVDIHMNLLTPEQQRIVKDLARKRSFIVGADFGDNVHFAKEVPGGRSNRPLFIRAAQGNSTLPWPR